MTKIIIYEIEQFYLYRKLNRYLSGFMKKCLCKLVVVFLVPLVLFSTTSFTIEKHKCGDNICAVSFKGFDSNNSKSNKTFSHSAKCCLEIDNTCCIDDVNCCEEDTTVVNGSTIKKEKKNLVKIESFVFNNSLFLTIVNKIYSYNKTKPIFNNYSPPLIVKDISVINQVFRI